MCPPSHCEQWRGGAKLGETEALRQCEDTRDLRVPILLVQLSWIWKVKFSPLQRCRARLSQDSSYCGEGFGLRNLGHGQRRGYREGKDGGKTLI